MAENKHTGDPLLDAVTDALTPLFESIIKASTPKGAEIQESIQVTNLKKRLERQEHAIAHLTDCRAELRAELDAANAENGKLLAETTSYKSQIEALNRKVFANNEVIARLSSEVNTLTAAKQDADYRLSKAHAEIKVHKDACADLKKKIDSDIVVKYNRLRKHYTAACNQRDAYYNALMKANGGEKVNKTLTDEIENLAQDVADYKDVIGCLKEDAMAANDICIITRNNGRNQILVKHPDDTDIAFKIGVGYMPCTEIMTPSIQLDGSSVAADAVQDYVDNLRHHLNMVEGRLQTFKVDDRELKGAEVADYINSLKATISNLKEANAMLYDVCDLVDKMVVLTNCDGKFTVRIKHPEDTSISFDAKDPYVPCSKVIATAHDLEVALEKLKTAPVQPITESATNLFVNGEPAVLVNGKLRTQSEIEKICEKAEQLDSLIGEITQVDDDYMFILSNPEHTTITIDNKSYPCRDIPHFADDLVKITKLHQSALEVNHELHLQVNALAKENNALYGRLNGLGIFTQDGRKVINVSDPANTSFLIDGSRYDLNSLPKINKAYQSLSEENEKLQSEMNVLSRNTKMQNRRINDLTERIGEAEKINDDLRKTNQKLIEDKKALAASVAEKQKLLEGIFNAEPSRISTPLGFLPVNASGMRTLIDFIDELRARGIHGNIHFRQYFE